MTANECHDTTTGGAEELLAELTAGGTEVEAPARWRPWRLGPI
jgi:hypothetical protein